MHVASIDGYIFLNLMRVFNLYILNDKSISRRNTSVQWYSIVKSFKSIPSVGLDIHCPINSFKLILKTHHIFLVTVQAHIVL